MTDEEYARYSPWQLQNQQGYNTPYPPNQQPPPGYSLLSEADVQRIAIAVVARLEALRGSEDR